MGWVHFTAVMVLVNIFAAISSVYMVLTEGTMLPVRAVPEDGSSGAFLLVAYIIANLVLACRAYNEEG